MSRAPHPKEPRVANWPIMLTGLVVLLLYAVIFTFEPRFLRGIALQSYDTLIKQNAIPPQSGRVLFVDISDRCIQEIGQWHWPRDKLARLANALWEAGASLLTFDVSFTEPDRQSPHNAMLYWRDAFPEIHDWPPLSPDLPDFDNLFAEALARGPSVLGFHIAPADAPLAHTPPEAHIPWRGAIFEKGGGRRFLPQGSGINHYPISPLRDNAWLGFYNTTPDQDNIVRRTPLVMAIGPERLFPALALEAVRLALGDQPFGVHYDREGPEGVTHIQIGSRIIPTDAHGRLIINFRSKRFPSLRASSILRGQFDPSQVKGKIVVIGSSSVGLFDLYSSPFLQEIPGAEILATVIDNLLAGDMLIGPRWLFFAELAALILGGLLLIGLVARTRVLLSLLVLLFTLLYPVALSLFLLRHHLWVFTPTPIMLGWALTYTGVTIMKYWQKEIIAEYDARLREMNTKLAQEIVVRTAAEEEAHEARNSALRAASAKSEFLANMSHEIRTPMNSVIGMCDLALRTTLTDKQRNYLGKIRHSAHALLRIINDILDFSKLEAGKLHIEQVEFNLEQELDDLADLLGHQAFKKGIDLLIDLPLDIPCALLGDPLRLRQVLINLTANAIKFTEKGHVAIQARVVNRDTASADIQFEVIDTGIGLTEKQQAFLFQAFQQADTSTTRKYGGTGLGLAISQTLVQLMGGQIEISSEPGKGSNFHFALPFKRQPPECEPIRELPPETHGRKVLLFGHAPGALDILTRLCRFLGLDPETRELAGWLAHADAPPAHLLIIDAQYPSLDNLLPSLLPGSGTPDRPPLIMIGLPSIQPDQLPLEDPTQVQFLAKPLKSSAMYSAMLVAWGYEPHPLAAAWSAPPEMEIAPGRLLHARVLLVDDNPINREVATENMLEFGILVEPAVNGQEAADKAAAQSWDLILMDIQMPVLDGYSATRLIREREQQACPPRPRTPIIAMTAHAMKEDEEKCLACGMDGYLSKPLEPDAFLSTLLRYIPATQTPRPAPAIPREPEAAAPASDRPSPPSREPVKPTASGKITSILDEEAALRRLRGNTALYERLLDEFASAHARDAARMRQAVSAGDFEQARTLAHAIKGSAANLGIIQVHQTAAAMDDLFRREQHAQAAEMLPMLEGALHAFLELRAPPAATATAPATSGTIEIPDDVRGEIHQVAALLREGSLAGLDRIEQLLPRLGTAGLDAARRKHILKTADAFELEKAARLLEALIKEEDDHE